MKPYTTNPNKCNLSRRDFLTSCAACAAGATALSTFGLANSVTAVSNQDSIKVKTKVRIIFAHPDPKQPNWPNIGYDFAGHIKQFSKKINQKCPDVDFYPMTVTSGSKEQAKLVLSKAPDVDGYIVYLVGCLWGELTETIVASGKQIIIIDHLFAGSVEIFTSFARAIRAGGYVISVVF